VVGQRRATAYQTDLIPHRPTSRRKAQGRDIAYR